MFSCGGGRKAEQVGWEQYFRSEVVCSRIVARKRVRKGRGKWRRRGKRGIWRVQQEGGKRVASVRERVKSVVRHGAQ